MGPTSQRRNGSNVFRWFERQGTYTRCEVLDLPAGGYELRVVHPDGTELVEHFERADDVADRQRAIEADLKSTGWTGPHGWVL